ncbi:MAG: DUF5107 domain-containing protein [Candidatus Sumerlaeia bacterium]|nr:DUF5107 domain-containing protein [Candidatus Sumerlaeia bacterium]
MKNRWPILLGWFVTLAAGLSAATPPQDAVRLWQETLTIPTYEVAPPDPSPLFFDGRTYQGAKGPFYPYPITDRLLHVRKDKTYAALYLENKYLKICVLPELGGRIFEGVDKTNGYNFFYRQHVIKPALIGMLGAWISGGVEWNIPHHHRASSFAPVQYATEEKADGSKTIWVGELELRHRMRWAVGLTLHPDKAYLEGVVRLINRTPVSHTFLYFANVAVHTNQDYQVIFPPSCQIATQHAKNEFARWPVADGPYAGVDYKGVDVSWWKNHPKPVSMFAHECKEDFLAGYDHGKQAGTLHVADHATMPGKKFFTWGTGAEGQMWDKLLTDTDGPYLELMVGGYSDNQPDYSWIQPYEVKEVVHCWYPFQKIGGVKNATREAAVNLEFFAKKVQVGFCTTQEFTDAKVLVKAADTTLFEKTISIAPDKPYQKEVALPGGTREEDVRVSLSAGGRELVAYQPVKRDKPPMPKPVEPPAAPKDIKTNEELYLAGMRLQQFYSPAKEPDPYFEEALRRDPGDYRCNVAMGILDYKRGMLNSAEKHFRAAVERATKNYTAPRDGEALYYLGITLKAQDKDDEAREVLGKAAWSAAWRSAAAHALAELAAKKGDPDRALSLTLPEPFLYLYNPTGQWLRAAICRDRKEYNSAASLALAATSTDPLNPWPKRERLLAQLAADGKTRPLAIRITDGLNDDLQPYLEMAFDYGNAGLYDEAIAALKEVEAAYPDKSRIHPMVYYALGYFADRQGNRDRAKACFEAASKLPPDYVFPFRLEEMFVLRRAMEANPQDPRAPYYLGNLLYDWQPAEAIELWEKARELDPKFAMTHRNLAWGYARVGNDPAKAAAALETALALDVQPRWLGELDRLYEATNKPANERLAFLEKHQKAVDARDDTLSRQVRLYILTGACDKALDILAGRQWSVWEGGASVHDLYVDALLLRGQERLKAKRVGEALKDFEAALEYPENFAVGKPYRGDRSPQIYYHIALAHEAQGAADKAKEFFEKCCAGSLRARGAGAGEGADLAYCQARSHQKLGRADEAKRIADRLIKSAQETLAGDTGEDFFAKFGERQSKNQRLANAHYALGLAHRLADKPADAKAEFQKALELNPYHLGAIVQAAGL